MQETTQLATAFISGSFLSQRCCSIKIPPDSPADATRSARMTRLIMVVLSGSCVLFCPSSRSEAFAMTPPTAASWKSTAHPRVRQSAICLLRHPTDARPPSDCLSLPPHHLIHSGSRHSSRIINTITNTYTYNLLHCISFNFIYKLFT